LRSPEIIVVLYHISGKGKRESNKGNLLTLSRLYATQAGRKRRKKAMLQLGVKQGKTRSAVAAAVRAGEAAKMPFRAHRLAD
jgi:hypothetical protein